VHTDDINNLRIVEDVHIPFEVTSDDELVKSSTSALDETRVHKDGINDEGFNDIQDALVKSSTSALDKTHVHEDSISDVRDALVESNTTSHDIRCSLSTLTIKEETEHEIVATSADTSKSLGFFPIVC